MGGNSFPGGEPVAPLGSRLERAGGQAGFVAYCDPGLFQFDVYAAGGAVTLTANVACDDGAFHHVALCFDGGQATLFYDGTLKQTKAATRAVTTTVLHVASWGSYAVAGTTTIDEVRFSAGVYLAVRARNVTQYGIRTTLAATLPGTGQTVPPTAYPYGLGEAADGACEHQALLFQVDAGGAPVADFLGKPLDVTLTVTEPDGRATSAKRRVTVATEMRFPTGRHCGP